VGPKIENFSKMGGNVVARKRIASAMDEGRDYKTVLREITRTTRPVEWNGSESPRGDRKNLSG